jgi:hypothetical protein
VHSRSGRANKTKWELVRKSIKNEKPHSVSLHDWPKLIGSGVSDAAEVCRSGGDYIRCYHTLSLQNVSDHCGLQLATATKDWQRKLNSFHFTNEVY